MNLSISTSSYGLVYKTPSQHVKPLSPSSLAVLGTLKSRGHAADYSDFEESYSQLDHSQEPKNYLRLLKSLNFVLADIPSSTLTHEELTNIFLKIYEKTRHFEVDSLPLIHKVYHYVYHLAKALDQRVGGESWGEHHAFEKRDRLTKALSLTAYDVAKLVIDHEVGSFFSYPQLLEKTDPQTMMIYKPLLDDRNKVLLEGLDPKTNLLKAAYKACSFMARSREISWVTGTNSYTLIGMDLAIQKGLTSRLTLIPTGELIKNDLVPLAGELGDGIKKHGINLSKLSGCHASHYLGAFEYATNQKLHYVKQSPIEALKRALKFLPRNKECLKDLENLNHFKIDLLRALYFGKLCHKERFKIKVILNVWLKLLDSDESLKLAVTETILKLLETTPEAIIAETFLPIYDHPPFPIVFGSTSLKEHDLKAARSSIRGEMTYKGRLELGKDIQILMTDDKHIKVLNEILIGYDIHILPLPVAEFSIRRSLMDFELNDLED